MGEPLNRLNHEANSLGQQYLDLESLQVLHWVPCRSNIDREYLLKQDRPFIQLFAYSMNRYSHLGNPFQHFIETGR
jgi:hypothetical protein